jgi:hypothetical protein
VGLVAFGVAEVADAFIAETGNVGAGSVGADNAGAGSAGNAGADNDGVEAAPLFTVPRAEGRIPNPRGPDGSLDTGAVNI